MEIPKLDSVLNRSIDKAREIRDKNFPGQIFFTSPNATTAITLTGKHCDLNCAHCGGKYLEHMIPLNNAAKVINSRESTSCLISGGCNIYGKVEIDIDILKPIIKGLKVNAHVGLITESEISTLAPYVDCISFDFIVEDDTIKEVYKLGKTGEDYIKAYQVLRKYAKVIPHICIGLRGGEISGEYQALKTLAQIGVAGLVFIVFIPTRGTFYENRKPPTLEEVLKIFVFARRLFPNIPLHLGCMRPGGKYRAYLDYYAVQAGINKIVNPTPLAIKKAKELGYQIVYEEECCVL